MRLLLLDRLCDVRPGERRRTALTFTVVFLVIAAYTMTKAARDALFLSRFSVADLSYLMIALAVRASLALALLGRAALVAPRNVLIVTSHLVVALSLLAVYAGLRLGAGRWLAWSFYLWSAVFGVFLVAQSWLLANDLFDARAARRLWGPIGTGAILGGIGGGRAAALIAEHVGAEALLPVIAVLLLLSALVAALAWRLRLPVSPEGDTASTGPTKAAGWRDAVAALRDDRYVRLIAAGVLVSTVCYTLIDWQFKGIARIHFHGRQDQLARFFGNLYSGVSVPPPRATRAEKLGGRTTAEQGADRRLRANHLAIESLRQRRDERALGFVETDRAPALGGERAHDVGAQPAGPDASEVGEVGRDVQREAVQGHPALDRHANRAELALTNPEAREARPSLATHVKPAHRADQQLLEGAQVTVEVSLSRVALAEEQDRIRDELARAMIGDISSALDLEERDVTRGENVALAPSAAPYRVDVRVLDENDEIFSRSGLTPRDESTLERPGLGILPPAEIDDVRERTAHALHSARSERS